MTTYDLRNAQKEIGDGKSTIEDFFVYEVPVSKFIKLEVTKDGRAYRLWHRRIDERDNYGCVEYCGERPSTFLLLINNGTEGWSIWGEFKTLDEAIKGAISNSYGSEYKIVKEVSWKGIK